ncbi:MAG: hypothetical protein AB1454_14890 [Candidatus Auribacterota bacterium]
MLTSENEKVAETGVLFLYYASLNGTDQDFRYRQYLSGEEKYQRGITEAIVVNFDFAEYLPQFTDDLKVLFNSAYESVRKATCGCFSRLKDNKLLQPCYFDVLKLFSESNAIKEDLSSLIRTLENLTTPIPENYYDVILTIINERMLQCKNDSNARYDMDHITSTIITMYEGTSDPAKRSECLNILDDLICHHTYGLDKVMQEYDR